VPLPPATLPDSVLSLEAIEIDPLLDAALASIPPPKPESPTPARFALRVLADSASANDWPSALCS